MRGRRGGEPPFEDQSFDSAPAFSTVHHWQDPIAGLRELRRVARRVVVFTHDDSETGRLNRFWLSRDYLPEVGDLHRVGPEAERRAVDALREDVASGRWAERNRQLTALDAAELGLRLLVT